MPGIVLGTEDGVVNTQDSDLTNFPTVHSFTKYGLRFKYCVCWENRMKRSLPSWSLQSAGIR